MFVHVKGAYRRAGVGAAVREAYGRALRRIGEAIGSYELTYNQVIFESFHRAAREAAPGFTAAFISEFPSVRSVADLGCGTGAYVWAMRERGLDAQGYEHSARARNMAAKDFGIELASFDLNDPASRVQPADASISIEVAEHLTPEMGEKLVQWVAKAAPINVFSAARPGQGGIGHINEQLPEYWQAQFLKCGKKYDEAVTERLRKQMIEHAKSAPWLGRNVQVFRAA